MTPDFIRPRTSLSQASPYIRGWWRIAPRAERLPVALQATSEPQATSLEVPLDCVPRSLLARLEVVPRSRWPIESISGRRNHDQPKKTTAWQPRALAGDRVRCPCSGPASSRGKSQGRPSRPCKGRSEGNRTTGGEYPCSRFDEATAEGTSQGGEPPVDELGRNLSPGIVRLVRAGARMDNAPNNENRLRLHAASPSPMIPPS